MTRDINALTEAASSDDIAYPILFIKLEFDSGTLRLHTQLGDFVWDSATWTGTGSIFSIGTVDEQSELERTPLSITLSGLDTAILSLVYNEHYLGRKATVYLGFLDPTTQQLVDDPIIFYRGRMDGVSIESGETHTITMNIESRMAAWDRPVIRRYNNEDQVARFPGDTGLSFVEQTTERNINWGQKDPT